MTDLTFRLTYIGGPTALLELNGVRLLTDPTFDPAGSEYPATAYTLRKLSDPAIGPEAIGRIEVVLLSHDHHFDNLDRAGRSFLPDAKLVVTTEAGATRLGGNAVGLSPWQSIDVPNPGGIPLRVTATPARHGPADGDRGPVIGFAVASADAPDRVVYISGDTVWYEGVEEVIRRFSVQAAILFMGAARVKAVGPAHLTFTAAEGVEAARATGAAPIIPLHYEGWVHFSESRSDIDAAFSNAGQKSRLLWPAPGVAVDIGI